jgi:hypothetical protein
VNFVHQIVSPVGQPFHRRHRCVTQGVVFENNCSVVWSCSNACHVFAADRVTTRDQQVDSPADVDVITTRAEVLGLLFPLDH